MSRETPSVEEYLLSKQKKRVYDKVPVPKFKGILMAIEKSTKPQIPYEHLSSLVKRGRQAANLMPRIRSLSERRKEAYTELVKGAVDYPGFGGFDIPQFGSTVRIRPEDNIQWDGPLLKERLGKTASAVVAEKLHMTLVLPLGHVMPDGEVLTSEKATAAIYAGVLAPLGFREDDEATTANISTEYIVNEELLGEMVQQEQVGSLEGTGVVTREFKIEVKA
jgi:hypothetical protein